MTGGRKNKEALFPNGNKPQSTQTSRLQPGMVEKVRRPGQSGNPGGRPAMSPEVKAALEGATLPAVQKQIELMSCGDVRVELLASQAILDRFYGKAAQAIDKTVTTTTVQAQHLSILMELQQKRDLAAKAVAEIEGHTDKVEEYDPPKRNE